MTRYVALLRGINVGGRNLIRMADLRACFEAAGFEDVATYIQSGNVLFGAPPGNDLPARLEDLLSGAFDYRASVAVRSHEQMRATVTGAPRGFGEDPNGYRYDVIFLKHTLDAESAIAAVATRPGVDEVHAGAQALYFSRLVSRAGQSKLSKIASSPIYPDITIRNWNTTTKLLQMLEDSPSA